MKYKFIHEHRKQYRVTMLCQALTVSRSSYHHWLKRTENKWKQENIALLKEIKIIYKHSRHTYGSPRVTDELHKRGYSCSRVRVARIMAKNNIYAKTKRKFKVTTNSQHSYPVSPNLLNQNFTAEHLNQKWASDITYIRTKDGWFI